MNKRQSLLLGCVFSIFAILAASCSSDDEFDSKLCRSWKLDGFGQEGKTEITYAEPRDCSDCYVVVFKKDGTVTGTTTTNNFSGQYKTDNGQIEISQCAITKVKEQLDGEKYYNSLLASHRYQLDDGELRLYYDNDGSYLLLH